MGCNCGKKRKKIDKSTKENLVQIESFDENGNKYYLIIDKFLYKVIDSCKSKFPHIPLVEGVRMAR